MAAYLETVIDVYTGLSSDNKATITSPKHGSIFIETDTADIYKYNAGNTTWYKIANAGSAAGTAPYIILWNTTEEDTSGGRESRVIGKGEQSGGEITTLGYIEFSHEGASDDQKGQIKILVNDGNDGNSPSKTGLTIASTGASTLTDVTLTTVNSLPINANIYAGLYNRNRDDKWIQKGKVTASHRYTLQSPMALGLYVTGKVYYISAQTDYDLSVEATWDTVAGTDYRVAATRAGKDFYIYACESATTTPTIKISANSSAPSGYTTANSRKIGGFHCLCVAVGTIAGHSLTDFVAGDILPDSIWDYNHRPVSSPEGMVYVQPINLWCDIYGASGTGASTLSVFGGTVTVSRAWYNFCDDGAVVNKRLLEDHEFSAMAAGSNEQTNIFGSVSPITAGGHVDAASRRMISTFGIEDGCGVWWWWLLTTTYQLSALAHTHSVTVSGDPQTVVSTSTDPLPAWSYKVVGGSKGQVYTQGTYGISKLLAGGDWANSAYSGSRSRRGNGWPWCVYTNFAGRFSSEPQR